MKIAKVNGTRSHNLKEINITHPKSRSKAGLGRTFINDPVKLAQKARRKCKKRKTSDSITLSSPRDAGFTVAYDRYSRRAKLGEITDCNPRESVMQMNFSPPPNFPRLSSLLVSPLREHLNTAGTLKPSPQPPQTLIP